MSDVLHIEIVQRRHRFVWICKAVLRVFALNVLKVIFGFSLVVWIEMNCCGTSGEYPAMSLLHQEWLWEVSTIPC